MTRLEEEMYEAINGNDWPPQPQRGTPFGDELLAVAIADSKAAAEVAKKYIQKAVSDLAGFVVTDGEYHHWLKENGITE